MAAVDHGEAAAGPGFWPLTPYNEHHFFHPGELDRYPFGTKIKDLHRARDGSLTLTASATARGPGTAGTWLPATAGGTAQMSGLSEVDIKRTRDQLFFEGLRWPSLHPSRVSPPGRVRAVLSERRLARRGSGKRRIA